MISQVAVGPVGKSCDSSVFSGRTLKQDTRQRDLGTENVIEENERSFDLEVMGGISAAGRLLIELPDPFYWKVSRTRPSAAAHAQAGPQ